MDEFFVDPESPFEVYIRMNGDAEKDYCFTVTAGSTFEDLFKIFDVLPLLLRPSIFYHPRPVGFQVSVDPGFLTREGLLLFHGTAAEPEHLVTVQLTDAIHTKCWPGQLIVPVWEHNSFNDYLVIAFLAAWLYTDLPDAILPTPGQCLTNQVGRLALVVVRYFDETMAQEMLDESNTLATGWLQYAFFAIHLVKCLLLYFLLYAGVFNPYRFLFLGRLVQTRTVKDLTRDELVAIGWTGLRRAILNEYREYYREYYIKLHGGIIPASKAGLFKQLTSMGVVLGKGEGFDTPIDAKPEDADPRKFVLSFDYLAKVGDEFEKQLDAGDNEAEQVKEFRRYGLMQATPEMREAFLSRLSYGNGDLGEEQE